MNTYRIHKDKIKLAYDKCRDYYRKEWDEIENWILLELENEKKKFFNRVFRISDSELRGNIIKKISFIRLPGSERSALYRAYTASKISEYDYVELDEETALIVAEYIKDKSNAS